MDFLMVLLGTQILLIAIFTKKSPTAESAAEGENKRSFQVWGVPAVLAATGVVCIVLGILFRMHRYH